jgi:hypothetical protein
MRQLIDMSSRGGWSMFAAANGTVARRTMSRSERCDRRCSADKAPRRSTPSGGKRESGERDATAERDKPRQGVVANTLKLFLNGAVGFMDWLGVDA